MSWVALKTVRAVSTSKAVWVALLGATTAGALSDAPKAVGTAKAVGAESPGRHVEPYLCQTHAAVATAHLGSRASQSWSGPHNCPGSRWEKLVKGKLRVGAESPVRLLCS